MRSEVNPRASFDFCGLYRLLFFVPKACLWTLLVSSLWPVVQVQSRCILLRCRQFPAGKCKWPITLSNHQAQLFRRGVSVYFKFFWIIWVGQDYILGDCKLYIIKCFLMYLIPVPWTFLCLFGFVDIGMTTLSYHWGEWSKQFAASRPKISIVLDHAQKPTEVFDLFWQWDGENCFDLLWLGLIPVCMKIYPIGIPFRWHRRMIYRHWLASLHLTTWLGPFVTCQGGLPGLPLMHDKSSR